jgi:hypothetical protein
MDINEVIKKILLNIDYDSSKTLSENRQLTEQPTASFDIAGFEQGPVVDNKGNQILKCGDNQSSYLITPDNKKWFFCGTIKNTIQQAPEVIGKKYIIGWGEIFNKKYGEYQKTSMEACVTRASELGRVKPGGYDDVVVKKDTECLKKRAAVIEKLENEVFQMCKSKLLSKKNINSLPATIEVKNGKSSGEYYINIVVKPNNECEYKGFNYFWHNNGDYPLQLTQLKDALPNASNGNNSNDDQNNEDKSKLMVNVIDDI